MGKTRLSLLAALAFSGVASACARDDVGPPKYALQQCEKVLLIDAASRKPVRGAEDLAWDRERGRLFVSAYDRRAVEKAARKGGAPPPQGGLYALPIDALFDAEPREIEAIPLAEPADFVGGLRPHGIDFDAANHELVFVNRTYHRSGRRWKMTPTVQRIGANGEAFVGEAAPAHCAVNDVVAEARGTLSTFNHASCGLGASLENVFRLRRSGLSDENGPLFRRAAFANGVMAAGDGGYVLAATRENALIRLRPDKDGLDEASRIETPGGPDNITRGHDGRVVAAVHPSLMSLMFNRKFGWGRAPSRIVKADLETGMVDILFDDPEGALFSAATVAIETPRGLVAGSVTDDGLLVCRSPA